MNHTTLKQLPESERPYERFLSSGAASLSDAELLAIIIKTGTKNATSLDLARTLLTSCQGNLLNLHECTLDDFMQVKGIGKVKAIQLKAVAELSSRIAKTTRKILLEMHSPATIAKYYMERLRHQKEEVFIGAFFDAKNQFLGDDVIVKGSLNCVYLTPADLFKKALSKNAISIVALHNHPSGNPYPSTADLQLTHRLEEGANILGLRVIDHIIIGDNEYYSFLEYGKIKTKED
mgnify:CR=1 FL=1